MNKAHPPTFQWSLLKGTLDNLKNFFPEYPKNPLIIISIGEQKLYFIENNELSKSYSISSAKAGIGNLSGSYKTPLGTHKIAEKIGEDAEIGTIFKARKNTQTIAKILTGENEASDEDNITTRILWLSGLEEDFNKGGDVDSYNRYIYIHGTDEEGRLGTPVSHGCIRMGNLDVVELFGLVSIEVLVVIAY